MLLKLRVLRRSGLAFENLPSAGTNKKYKISYIIFAEQGGSMRLFHSLFSWKGKNAYPVRDDFTFTEQLHEFINDISISTEPHLYHLIHRHINFN